MKTIFCVFRDYQEARETVDQLLGADHSEDQMNVIIEQSAAKNAIAGLDFHKATTEKSDEIGQKQVRGLDAMLVGRQPVRVSDVGDLYSAGELATMIARTASAPSATDGGLTAALNDFGVPVEVGQSYVDEINQGSVLFFLRTEDERASEVVHMIKNNGALYVDSYPR